ncbi:MAG: PilZ domain-containing protein [Myxococcales bacterium]
MVEHYRQHPRVAPPSEVILRQGAGELRCRARNLSITGCFLETPGELQAGMVDLVFMEPSGGEAVRCRGQILRREPRGLAVRFLGLEWGELFGLARLVAPGLAT